MQAIQTAKKFCGIPVKTVRINFSLAEETANLCKTIDLSFLSKERVYGEMQKALLKAERPSVFFEVLRQTDALSVWFGELQKLIGVEQNPRYHPEGDVWTHTMLVVDKAAGLRDRAENPLGFMLAALCHDLGKASTTERVGERIHAYGHEEAGIVPAREFLSRFSVEQETEDYVLNMILLHMKPNLMAAQRSGLKAMCRLFDRSVSPNDLLLLAKCDHGVGDYAETACWLWTQYDLFQARMALP